MVTNVIDIIDPIDYEEYVDEHREIIENESDISNRSTSPETAKLRISRILESSLPLLG